MFPFTVSVFSFPGTTAMGGLRKPLAAAKNKNLSVAVSHKVHEP